MPKFVDAVVKGPRPFFYDSLHQPGEPVRVDLERLGIKSLDETDKLEAPNKDNVVQQVEISPVAPHAPNPVQPQGEPAGGEISSTGAIIHPQPDGGAVEYKPEGTAGAAKKKG